MSQITIEEIEDALVPFFQAIDGLVTVWTDFPDEIQSRELPAVVLSPKTASYDRETYGVDSLLVRREWRAVLFAAEGVIGREFQPEQAAKPFLSRLPDALAALGRVVLDDGRGFDALLHGRGDTGVASIPYNGRVYVGVSVSFTVETIIYIEEQ